MNKLRAWDKVPGLFLHQKFQMITAEHKKTRTSMLGSCFFISGSVN